MPCRVPCRLLPVLLCLLAAAGALAGPVSPQGIELLDFRVAPEGGARVGDTLSVSFALKNVSSQPVTLDPAAGALVGARFARGEATPANRDFGHQAKGAVLAPGQTLTIKAERTLEEEGTWQVWPGFLAQGQWASFDHLKKIVRVGGEAAPAAPPAGKAGGGATVVPWREQKLPLQFFPPDNPWNQDISRLAVHPNSEAMLRSIGWDKNLHPDFSSGREWNQGVPYGTSFLVVRGDQAKVPVRLEWAGESDPGPYPIPDDYPVAKEGDRHVLVLDYDGKKLYELYGAARAAVGWQASAGAIFDLTSNALRPLGHTSADAAGLPILAGLVRHEELATLGEIPHALRFTARRTRKAYLPPATHQAGQGSDPSLPPMGLRVRLKAGFDLAGFPPQARIIAECLKKYGMLLADNGGEWFLTGAPSAQWDDSQLVFLKKIKGRDLEAVFTGEALR